MLQPDPLTVLQVTLTIDRPNHQIVVNTPFDLYEGEEHRLCIRPVDFGGLMLALVDNHRPLGLRLLGRRQLAVIISPALVGTVGEEDLCYHLQEAIRHRARSGYEVEFDPTTYLGLEGGQPAELTPAEQLADELVKMELEVEQLLRTLDRLRRQQALQMLNATWPKPEDADTTV